MIAYLYSVLKGSTPCHLVCDLRGCEVTEVTRRDRDVFLAHRKLLCPCGGTLRSVHPAFTGGRR